jgi:hypothetical protein
MKTIEFDEKCQSCGGTGLYVGMGERNGAAVVCHTCDGTGKHHFTHNYEEFTERVCNPNVRRVLQCNPGIMVGESEKQGCKLEDFGGMNYKEWIEGDPFPKHSEMRKYTCPAWWYQSADYKRMPEWESCTVGGSFSSCDHFKDKAKCWERFDKEGK